ncbi:LeuD/DmdB family oxidoreductase small subunit [Eubacterium sp.]|uniref:LeuD/DmdB family oxidoreductase small subunit n=1 Tax=Eubacterium sp. TaxID=142586 RepID=UPI002FC9EEB6
MAKNIRGRSLKYGSNINTDIISPPAYMELSMEEAAQYAMSPVDPDFAKVCRSGDIFVAENNLGSGSSRETAPLTLKILGITTIIAKSYARIFYRNCINLGILVIECSETEKISNFDHLDIDYESGKILNETTGENYRCSPIPSHIMSLVNTGGLVEYIKTKMTAQ